jgi:hypothetical protein
MKIVADQKGSMIEIAANYHLFRYYKFNGSPDYLKYYEHLKIIFMRSPYKMVRSTLLYGDKYACYDGVFAAEMGELNFIASVNPHMNELYSRNLLNNALNLDLYFNQNRKLDYYLDSYAKIYPNRKVSKAYITPFIQSFLEESLNAPQECLLLKSSR